MDLTQLVDTIDKLYKTDNTHAKIRVKQLLFEELDLRIRDEKLQLLKELHDGFRILLKHLRNEINKPTTRQ